MKKPFGIFCNTPQTSKNIKLANYYIAKCYRYGRGVKSPNLTFSNEYLNESRPEYYQWWDEKVQCIEECYLSEKILDVMKADVGTDLGTILREKKNDDFQMSQLARVEYNIKKKKAESRGRKSKEEPKTKAASIWLEAAKAQLNSQSTEDALSYEDAMLELEKEQLDKRLSRIRAEKESYDNLVSEEAKNMAPTFGLR